MSNDHTYTHKVSLWNAGMLYVFLRVFYENKLIFMKFFHNFYIKGALNNIYNYFVISESKEKEVET